MRVKVIYRKSLKMSEGKLSAQVAHAVIGLGITDPTCTIIVLGMSDTQFGIQTQDSVCYIHEDYGLTEVKNGEKTCAAWLEY